MKDNQKISLVLVLVFLIVFSSFFLFYFFNPLNYNEYHEFYSSRFPIENKKIIILGSSYLGQLNTTMINEKIPEEFDVYNLAIAGDWPSERLKIIEPTISLNPDLVIIGIVNYYFVKEAIDEELLPSPNNYFKKTIEFVSLDRMNPQKITRIILKNSLESLITPLKTENDTTYKIATIEKTPFYSVNYASIKDLGINEKIENKKMMTNDYQIESLKKIINRFQEEDVKVVLLKIPYSRVALNQIPENFEKTYDELSNEISKQHNVTIYDFTYKYADLPIWFHEGHIAYAKEAQIFSEDFIELILKEIKK